MAFYQKYRPKTFSELIGEEHVSATLLQGIKSNKLTHAYLLTGPRGTGKTTTARLLAKAINCEHAENSQSGEPCNECESCLEISDGRAIDIVEIDAASHTKVDEIREVIENARFLPTKAKKKVYIIDEVHMLSNSSFNALLKTLEEPPSHVVFILATTEVHKLPATILSRTQRYDFHRISKKDLVRNLEHIAKAEKIKIDPIALDLIAVVAEGGHRDAIGLLEQVASTKTGGELTLQDVEKILGITSWKEVFAFIGAIFNKIPEEGLKIAHQIYEGGGNMTAFNKNVIEVLRRLMLFKMANAVLFEDTKENLEQIKRLSQEIELDDLLKRIDIFIKAGSLLKDVSYPLLPIEIAVIESCQGEKKFSLGKAEVVESSKVTVKPKAEVKLAPSDSDPKPEVKPTKQEAEEEVPKIEVAGSVPVSVLQMTDDIWQKVIEQAKAGNPTLAALLRDARPVEFNENKIVLGVKFPFHKDKISEDKNRTFLEDIFSEIVGQKCLLSCAITDLKPKKASIEIKDEELQKAAEEIFS